jgi:hypothetical protein
MAEKFDSYRDALVVETDTLWPADLPAPQPAERAELERRLHAAPEQAATLDYIRLHAGFCRRITVTPADLERLKKVE